MSKKDIILKAENISKQYRLGVVGTGTLSHDVNRWWHKVRGKEDPYLKVGEANDRTTKGTSEYVWALQDINFEVERGEVLGIIGKNGAGKSTLLKILSKVTAPTTGSIKTRGRIASLLEVGTGFHPELTGRENVYLNGAILGMTKKEITAKLDEIIAFSGCERYIDTPTKRYSSGMTVRLAFAVAAFLEPEILVVDEVLAVGDAEFQKKAIGKMQDISKGDGRTVLFVSHNMSTINSLCKNSIMLENGRIFKTGPTSEIIPYYLSSSQSEAMISMVIYENDNLKKLQIVEAKLIDNSGELISDGIVSTSQDFFFEVVYNFKEVMPKCHLTYIIKNSLGEVVLFVDRTDFYKEYFVAEAKTYKSVIKIQNPLLKPGVYYVSLGLADQYSNLNDHKFDVLKFKIEDLDSIRSSRQGDLFLPTEWEMKMM
ncbi:ABC transporter ATP-binding protein [Flavobacterium tibetense]|uniref:ABC transporter ATP-binding protein n=1 Tax=Flavobacterium tibetense TaxID=2233533 RepID=A0A365P3I2_9FLAO|nr:ABC transporter ATP-binding protein [Flavobacterium tibetense]RBA29124.1 ABC transporter ATP-binding protein [Flavobacterium tibetense]